MGRAGAPRPGERSVPRGSCVRPNPFPVLARRAGGDRGHPTPRQSPRSFVPAALAATSRLLLPCASMPHPLRDPPVPAGPRRGEGGAGSAGGPCGTRSQGAGTVT